MDAISPTSEALTQFASQLGITGRVIPSTPRTQPDLFFLAPKARRPRRVMMHHIDAGPGTGELNYGAFKCKKCGAVWESHIVTDTQLRRGIPCPVCNV